MPHQGRIATHVVIRRLEFSSGELHPQLRVPCLRFPDVDDIVVLTPDVSLILITLCAHTESLRKEVLCVANVQHDCTSGSNCGIRNVRERQERIITTRLRQLIDHAPNNAYFLNIHALHNYRYISALLPPNIRAQISMPWILDHHAIHLHAAALVRQKKAMDSADPVDLEKVRENDTGDLPPAFDRSTSNKRKKGKAKVVPKKKLATGPDPGPSTSQLQHPQQVYSTLPAGAILQNEAVFSRSDTLGYVPSGTLQPHGYSQMHAGPSEPARPQHHGYAPPTENFTHTSYPPDNFSHLSVVQHMPPHLPAASSFPGHFLHNFRAYDGH